ncbi:hypothetical protein [Streptomyces sp. NPDC002328]|uniref:effector-associated domain 2-containing protein n=1 Tax=Streptomyces sp. NPDC002328 TaxID=3364642 RepID=UPI00369E40A6
MTKAQGEPVRGRAVLVAVETYEAGSTWELDGPVRDALAHRAWLLDQGVDPAAITVLASPSPHHRALLKDAGVEWREAQRDSVHQVLFREAAVTTADWLYVAWSGHGLVDLDGHRRLLYADAMADDLRSLDLEAALAAFRSDLVPGHPRQLWIVDACQTFVDAAKASQALRPDPVPRGRLRQVQEQRVLFACGPGEVTGSGSRDGKAAGAFSAAVLDLLSAHPDWAHDTASLAAALRERFHAAAQTRERAPMPTSLWFDGAGESNVTQAARTASPRRLELADQRRLYEALAAVPVMQDPGLRAAVIGRLPSEICASVPRSTVMRIEILELVGTCTLFDNGLGHLWEAVSLLDAGTLALDGLEAVLTEYPQWFRR